MKANLIQLRKINEDVEILKHLQDSWQKFLKLSLNMKINKRGTEGENYADLFYSL